MEILSFFKFKSHSFSRKKIKINYVENRSYVKFRVFFLFFIGFQTTIESNKKKCRKITSEYTKYIQIATRNYL